MAKNVKNIGIDMGNSTICVAGMDSKGEIIKYIIIQTAMPIRHKASKSILVMAYFL